MARILVADDDPIFNSYLKKALSSQGHQVVSAYNGLEALGKIYAEEFDLAVMDVVLPHIGGIRLLDAIKKYHPSTMVVMVSGQADINIAIESIRSGAYDFIKKPVRIDQLRDTVAGALAEAESMKKSGYIYKDIRRDHKPRVKKNIIYAISDSLMVSLAFLAAIFIQSLIMDKFNQPPLISDARLVRVSLGLAFCYGFIFVFRRCYRIDNIGKPRGVLGYILTNLTQTYIIFAAVLFLGRDVFFMANRSGIGLGFIFGAILLYANRILIIPNLLQIFEREGRKKIIITAPTRAKAESAGQNLKRTVSDAVSAAAENDISRLAEASSKARLITSIEDIDKAVIDDNAEELYISNDLISSGEILNILNRFENRRLKIIVVDKRDKVLFPTESGVL